MSERAGGVYLQHIRDQLAEQRDRKKSLEQRGQSSVAVSGGFVTLLLGIANVSNVEISTRAGVAATVALLLLAAGAVAGIIVAAPGSYEEMKVRGMRKMLTDDRWSEPVGVGEQKVARNLLNIIGAAKRANRRKANTLLAAVGLQGAGVHLMAVTLLAISV